MTVPDTAKSQVFSLYRSFRRQANLLPSEYLRQFFRIKLADDVRNILKTPEDNELRRKRVKNLQRVLYKVRAANERDVKAFAHITDLAYGRKGRLRRELMEPILAVLPNMPQPNPIIPSVEKSRPPVYTPELKALLTSTASRLGKSVLRPSHLDTPKNMPARADPNSEEAKIMGPLSKRRELNIRWRFYKTESSKVVPPLQVVVEERFKEGSTCRTDKHALERAGVRAHPFQGMGIFEEIEILAGPAICSPRFTRKERQRAGGSVDTDKICPTLIDSHLPQRYLRRRYQQLLSRIPVLTYSYKNSDDETSSTPGKYSVSLPPAAMIPAFRLHHARLPLADNADVEWFNRAKGTDKQ